MSSWFCSKRRLKTVWEERLHSYEPGWRVRYRKSLEVVRESRSTEEVLHAVRFQRFRIRALVREEAQSSDVLEETASDSSEPLRERRFAKPEFLLLGRSGGVATQRGID